MPIARGEYAEVLGPVLTFRTFNKYREHPEIYRGINNVKDSNRAFEDDFAITGFGPLIQKGELEKTIMDEPIKLGGTRIIHRTYGLGFMVSQEMREDQQQDLVGQLADDLGRSSRWTAELYGHDVWNNAFSGTKYLGRDGKVLIATDHPIPGLGTTYANRPAADLDLSQLALEAAWGNFAGMVNDRGMPVESAPKTLLIHPSNYLFAKRLLMSAGYPGGNSNDINPLYDLNFNIVQSPYLTDPDAWFLLGDISELDVLFYWRRKPDTRTWDDNDAEATIHKISQRHSVGFRDWRHVYGSTGA